MPDSAASPLTTVVVRRARPGLQSEYERWLEGIIAAAATFPGHMGVTVLKPPPGGREYVLIVRWRDFPSSRAWVESETRRDWLARLEPIAEQGAVEEKSGLETWFTLASDERGAPPPPSRGKMAVVTFLAIYPLILALSYTVMPALVSLPVPLRPLVTTGLLVPMMTWLVMPRMTRWFWPWLFPGHPRPG